MGTIFVVETVGKMVSQLPNEHMELELFFFNVTALGNMIACCT